MQAAFYRAREAAKRGDVPVGAVVVRGDVIIGSGSNIKCDDPTSHAEINAIRSACKTIGGWNLSDCEMYVTLEPCPMCAGAIVAARVRRVVFACRDPKAGAGGTLYNILHDTRLNHRCEVISGILSEESRELLVNFFRGRREK